MFKRLAARLLGLKSLGWVNVYRRVDGTRMTGSMIYKTRLEAMDKGLCHAANSTYIGTVKFYC